MSCHCPGRLRGSAFTPGGPHRNEDSASTLPNTHSIPYGNAYTHTNGTPLSQPHA